MQNHSIFKANKLSKHWLTVYYPIHNLLPSNNNKLRHEFFYSTPSYEPDALNLLPTLLISAQHTLQTNKQQKVKAVVPLLQQE